MKTRKELLEELIVFRNPLELDRIQRDIGDFGWGRDEILVTIARENIVSLLKRFLSGDLTAQNIHDWVDAFVPREDRNLGTEGVDEECVRKVFHVLETPELEGIITKERAARLLSVLDQERIPTSQEVAEAYFGKKLK